MLRSATLVALTALAAPAYGFTDAPFDVGGTGSEGTNDRALKFNRYDVQENVMLQEFQILLNPDANNAEGVFAVYEEAPGGGGGGWGPGGGGGGVAWDLIWDSGAVVISAGEGFKSSGAVALPLVAGTRYLIGYYIIDDTQYFHEDVGDENLGWAVVDRTTFNTGGTFGGIPNSIDSGVSEGDSHYRQHLIIGFPDDLDNDGYTEIVDCDDNDATVNPGAPELCDGLDNNCNDLIDDDVEYHDVFEDSDGDGYGADEGVVDSACEPDPPAGFANENGDCDDQDDQINPGMEELCDGLDNNCDGNMGALEFDLDGDGVFACTDCDDGDADVFPGQLETCNGVDNDCDGDAPTADNCNIDNFSTESLVLGQCACNQGAPGGALPGFALMMLAGLIRRRRA